MVEKTLFAVIWSPDAKSDLKEILNWYRNKSKTAKSLVKLAIFDTISKLRIQPYIFETDKFKIPSQDSYRAFTIYHTRITFEIVKNEIHILRLRHTSQDPLKY